jgi:hypothetical protein
VSFSPLKAGGQLERTGIHAVILVKTCLAAVVNWKMYSYFDRLRPFLGVMAIHLHIFQLFQQISRFS